MKLRKSAITLLQAIYDSQKPAELLSLNMTGVLCVYRCATLWTIAKPSACHALGLSNIITSQHMQLAQSLLPVLMGSVDNLGALKIQTSSCRASQTCAVSVRCSALFMRFAFAIRPQNPILFACHLTNEVVQLNQLRRCLNAKSSLAVSSRVRHTGPTNLLL